MAVRYNIKNDIRYNQGLEKGIEKGRINQQQAIVKNLLLYTSLTTEEIAKVTNSTLEFVAEIKKSIA